MTSAPLAVLLHGTLIGRITRDRLGKLALTYTTAWQENPLATPLSLSMPLASSEHSHQAVEAFLWGLLPDNPAVLGHLEVRG